MIIIIIILEPQFAHIFRCGSECCSLKGEISLLEMRDILHVPAKRAGEPTQIRWLRNMYDGDPELHVN